jgi:hypothetical protein
MFLPVFFLIRIVGGGVQTGSTRHVGHWMAYCTCPGWLWWWRIWWNEDWQGKPKYSEKTCPSATLSTTNPTWPEPGLNPGRRGGKPATNSLSYGAAFSSCWSNFQISIASSIFSRSCDVSRMRLAYFEFYLFCLISWICSVYFVLKFLPACPIYTLLR